MKLHRNGMPHIASGPFVRQVTSDTVTSVYWHIVIGTIVAVLILAVFFRRYLYILCRCKTRQDKKPTDDQSSLESHTKDDGPTHQGCLSSCRRRTRIHRTNSDVDRSDHKPVPYLKEAPINEVILYFNANHPQIILSYQLNVIVQKILSQYSNSLTVTSTVPGALTLRFCFNVTILS